jgi:hypothetical protein
MTTAEAAEEQDGWIGIQGPFDASGLRALRRRGAMARLRVSGPPLLTAAIARGFDSLVSVQHLRLQCTTTRTAMRHVVAVPGLRVLEVLRLQSPGRLQGFAANHTLEVFRSNQGLSEADLVEITACPSLRQLAARGSNLTARAFEALLPLMHLETLDLQDTRFDDSMAARLHARASLRRLRVRHTALTREGLQHIARLRQLRALDIGANAIAEADIDLLAALPQLECLSLGRATACGALPPFDARTLLPRLQAIPALKHVVLEGVAVDDEQRTRYERHFERVEFGSVAEPAGDAVCT